MWTWAMAKLWALSNAQPIQLHWDAIMCGINVCWKGEALSFVHDRMLQFHMYQPFLVVGDGTYLRCWMEWWLYNDILYNCRWKKPWREKRMRRVKGWRCPGFSISGYPSQMWKSRFFRSFLIPQVTPQQWVPWGFTSHLDDSQTRLSRLIGKKIGSFSLTLKGQLFQLIGNGLLKAAHQRLLTYT